MSSKKVLLIADSDILSSIGGGELNDLELFNKLSESDAVVDFVKSSEVNRSLLNENYSLIILSNFLEVSKDCLDVLLNKKYIIYEHDHKYLFSRIPDINNNLKSSINEKRFIRLYQNAIAVLCQSELHCEAILSNVNTSNIVNIGGNLWSDTTLDTISSLSESKKSNKASILRSRHNHKNTIGAIKYCVENKIEYELIEAGNNLEFLKLLSRNNKLVFLPQTPETLSRLVVEALMMDIEVISHEWVGVFSESWSTLPGKEIIQKMKDKKTKILKLIKDLCEGSTPCYNTENPLLPKISLITSIYNADDHIEGFLSDITSQTIFNDCELIIIDGNSPGSEVEVIKEYQKKFKNIIYKRLSDDPGIYGCWNEAIKLSSGEFISNANVDDRRSFQQLEILANHLNKLPDVDLVYSEFYVTHSPSESFLLNSSNYQTHPTLPFSPRNMRFCPPGCMPLWRSSLHDKYGHFDASLKFAGDLEMWLRACSKGSVFAKKRGVHGLYYHKPNGLTTSPKLDNFKRKEEVDVLGRYASYINE